MFTPAVDYRRKIIMIGHNWNRETGPQKKKDIGQEKSDNNMSSPWTR